MKAWEEDSALQPFLDLIFILLLCCVVLINPKKQEETKTLKQHAVYQFMIEWDGESPNDIDLWATDPKENTVSFKRREGGQGCLMSLDHDDLGARNDTGATGETIEVNKEVINIRGLFPGEYIFNCHAYSIENNTETEVTGKLVQVKPFKVIKTVKRTLIADGDEQTFFRLTFDEYERIVDQNEMQKVITTP